MKTCFLLIVLTLLACTVEGGQSLINTRAPEFSLRDQYDQPYSLQSFAGQPVVLIASDKEGSGQNRHWLALLKEKYGRRLRIIGVADVRTVPFFLKGMVRGDFKKDGGSVLMDWDGALFTAYGLAKNVSNVILIDNSGSVQYLYAGSPSREATERLFGVLDGLVK